MIVIFEKYMNKNKRINKLKKYIYIIIKNKKENKIYENWPHYFDYISFLNFEVDITRSITIDIIYNFYLIWNIDYHCERKEEKEIEETIVTNSISRSTIIPTK